MSEQIYRTNVKSHNIHILLDCTDYLLIELMKLEEATTEEVIEFANLMFREKDFEKAAKHNIMLKMWKLLNYFASYYTYLFFSKKFIKTTEVKYELYLTNDLKTILLLEKDTNKIIDDKQFIKDLLQDDYKNNKVSMSINIRSFFEKEEFKRIKDARDYVINYFNLNIKVNDDIAIVFTSSDIFLGKEKKEWELYKSVIDQNKKVKEELLKR